MKANWEWKLKLINGFCQGYFLVFAALTLIVGFNITLPYLYADDSQRLFHLKVLAVYVFFNMFANYVWIRYTAKYSLLRPAKRKENNVIFASYSDNCFRNGNGLMAHPSMCPTTEHDCQSETNSENKVNSNGSGISLGGWTHCKDCADLVPPRTKHCPLCNACILKRDHHCFFAGCCVGFHNQRYFAIFCLYGAIGSIYSSLITHYYLRDHYEGVQAWGIVAYFLPFLLWYWMTGVTSGIVVMTLFLCWNCLTAFMCTYYFGVQAFLIYRGQTKYECMKGIHSYRGSVWLNLKSVFGGLWFVGLAIPLPFLRYYGDGKNWDEFSLNKIS